MRHSVTPAALILFVTSQCASTQEEKRGVLGVGQVNYWGTHSAASRLQSRASEEGAAVSVWAEPIRTPDGRYGVYVPPPQVLQFLEDPTPERARAYVRWQQERVSKLRRALEMLQAIASDEKLAPNKVAPIALDPTTFEQKSSTIEILYFKQPSCTFCNMQDEILTEVRKRWPHARIREVAKGQNQALWAKFGITVTPTLVFRPDAQAPIVARGLVRLDQVGTIIRKLTDEK